VKIVLHIERLVLDGVALDASAADVVRASLIRELTQMLSTGSVPSVFSRGEALPRVQAPEVTLTRAEGPSLIGRNVARSVHAGLST
jgi:hypothetical protein